VAAKLAAVQKGNNAVIVMSSIKSGDLERVTYLDRRHFSHMPIFKDEEREL
jgi:hypothetical protein